MNSDQDVNSVARTHSVIMDGLKSRHAALNEVVPVGRPIVYLDYPLNMNIGDFLIHAGTNAFFRHHGHKVIGEFSIHDFCMTSVVSEPAATFKRNVALLDAMIGKDTVIVMHGGGNLGDIYKIYQAFREIVVERYRRNRVVIFPQSVHFNSAERMERAAKRFASHPDLHIFVRDRTSVEFIALARAHGGPMPDMAHELWRTPPYGSDGAEPAKGILRLMRRDEESWSARPAWAGVDGLAGEDTLFDWNDLYSPLDWLVMRFIRKWQTLVGPTRLRIPSERAWLPFRDAMIRRAIRLFNNHGAIYTDRLHAMILASLLEKRVFVADNSYGKLSRYYRDWFGGSDMIEFVSNPSARELSGRELSGRELSG